MVAVAVAGVAYFIIGALWYSVLFGKLWIKLMDVNPEDLTPPGSKMIYVVSGSFLTAYIMAHFVEYGYSYMKVIIPDLTPLMGGIQTGFWAWLGFVAMVGIHQVVYESKPFKLYLLNMGYYFVSFLAMGGIIGWMS